MSEPEDEMRLKPGTIKPMGKPHKHIELGQTITWQITVDAFKYLVRTQQNNYFGFERKQDHTEVKSNT